MKIKSVEEKAYVEMQQAFQKFVREIEVLCIIPEISKEWMDNAEVCQLWNIDKRTLQYYRSCGYIPFSMIGGKCYYKTGDVEKLIEILKIK